MISIDKGLYSPFPDIHNVADVNKYNCYEKHLTNLIAKARDNVLNNETEIQNFKNVRNLVIESWIRSKNKGINPKTSVSFVENVQLEMLLQQKKIFVDTVMPFINQLELLLHKSGYMIGLYDLNGVILYLKGDKEILKIAERHQVLPGAIFSEDTVGTCSNGLCSILKMPIQISGPEHYSENLLHSNCSSAPIFLNEGELAGILSIESILTPKWHPHTLGLVISTAKMIQNEISLIQKNKDFHFIESALKDAIKKNDDAYLIINDRGKVVYSNAVAHKFLGISDHDLSGKHYTDFLGDQSEIARALRESYVASNTEAIASFNKVPVSCTYSVNPIKDDIQQTISGAIIAFSQKQKSYKAVKNPLPDNDLTTFEEIIGKSESFKTAINYARNVSVLPVNILLTGESGTGKELFAQAIHQKSGVEGQFVAVNCAALPRTLIESELFGYEGGSFTGANRQGRPGKIEQANGGTLFLDEIGDMPLEMQPVLLRVLQDKKVTRIGSSRSMSVDFRLISATNKNLTDMINKKQFREDLYFRLVVLKIAIPPLRERDNDIEILANFFLERFSRKMDKVLPKISKEALKFIKSYSWPGNIRQLENAMVHALCVCSGDKIEKDHLPEEIFIYRHLNNTANEVFSINEIEKNTIIKVMQRTHNNTLRASELLGIARTTLYKKLKEYNITYN